MLTKPRQYQRKGARMIHRFNGRALLADDMGLGKSLQSLLYAHKTPKARPIIVVCPAGLKLNWQDECRIHFGMRAEVLSGMKVPRAGLRTPHQVIIVNYDILGAWLPFLRRLKPQLIIVDECHYIMNPKALRTKRVKKLCRRVKRVIMLGGTPMVNRPVEMYPALNILRPDVFPSFFAYATRYCQPRRRPWGWEFKGATNLDELHQLLTSTVMIRRLKQDVLKDLPPKLRIVVPLEIQDRKQYDFAMKNFLLWMKKNHSTKAKKAGKAEQLTKMGYIKRLIAELKLKSVIDWIDNYLADSDSKLLVFGHHKAILRPLAKHYGRRAVLVDGTVTGRARHKAYKRFNTAPRVRLLFGNMKAAGVGWNAKTHSVAKVELAWTPGDHTQAEDRAWGLGRGVKNTPTTIYYLIARNTYEEVLCRIIQQKQKILSETLDGKGKGIILDVFDLLMKELSKKRAA